MQCFGGRRYSADTGERDKGHGGTRDTGGGTRDTGGDKGHGGGQGTRGGRGKGHGGGQGTRDKTGQDERQDVRQDKTKEKTRDEREDERQEKRGEDQDEPPGTENEWHIRVHGAFEIKHEVLGIKLADHSCHLEVWIHLSHVNARLVDR